MSEQYAFDDENTEITQVDNPDGTVDVTITEIDPDAQEAEVTQITTKFDANLATVLPAETLKKVSRQVLDWAEEDGDTRDEWFETYSEGLHMLGLKYEERTDPWEGACGATHPMMIETTIRFQADAMSEVLPPSGPVKEKIIGRITPKKEKQAARIKQDLNYQFMHQIPGYVDQTEKLLMNLPVAGSCYRHFWYDKFRKRSCSEYLSAERLRIPYGCSSLEEADHFIIDLPITHSELERQQRAGHWRDDVDLVQGVVLDPKESDTTKDEIEGQAPTVDSGKDEYLFYQCYGLYRFEELGDEIAVPYITTVDSVSGEVVSIYRNYRQDDETFEAMQWVVPWVYLPPLKGPYGLGIINVLGNTTESATSLLRQLVDAGTLANMPAGFKDKSLRIKGDNTPFTPGEWRSVDAAGMNLRDGFMPLPYKEPSPTLFQLLSYMSEEGRRVGAMADMKVADMGSQQMPVGTVLAILERTMKVMSGVMRRLHTAMGKEIRIVARMTKDYGGEAYPFELDEDDAGATRTQDYDDRVDVEPVSNPNAATQGQRIMKAQAVLQVMQGSPEGFDEYEVKKRMLTAMDVDDVDMLLPSADEVKPLDPLTENMNLITGRPVRAGMGQDHEAHITAHMAAIENPQIGQLLGQSPAAQGILAAAQAHIQEHVAFQMRIEVEKAMGMPLPPPGEPLPEDVEVLLSQMIARAMEKIGQKARAEQQEKEVLDKLEDPVVQNQRMAEETKRMDVERKTAEGERKLQLQDEKQKSDEAIKRASMIVDLFKNSQDNQRATTENENKMAVEGAKAGIALVEKNVRTPKDTGAT